MLLLEHLALYLSTDIAEGAEMLYRIDSPLVPERKSTGKSPLVFDNSSHYFFRTRTDAFSEVWMIGSIDEELFEEDSSNVFRLTEKALKFVPQSELSYDRPNFSYKGEEKKRILTEIMDYFARNRIGFFLVGTDDEGTDCFLYGKNPLTGIEAVNDKLLTNFKLL